MKQRRVTQSRLKDSQAFKNQSGRGADFLLSTMAATAATPAHAAVSTSKTGRGSLSGATAQGEPGKVQLELHPLVQAPAHGKGPGHMPSGRLVAGDVDDGMSDAGAADAEPLPTDAEPVQSTLGDAQVTTTVPGRLGLFAHMGLSSHGQAAAVPVVPQLDLAAARAVLRAEEAAEARAIAVAEGELAPIAARDGRLGSVWANDGAPDKPAAGKGGAQARGDGQEAPLVTLRTEAGRAAPPPGTSMPSFQAALKQHNAERDGYAQRSGAVSARNPSRTMPHPPSNVSSRRMRGGVSARSGRARRVATGGVASGEVSPRAAKTLPPAAVEAAQKAADRSAAESAALALRASMQPERFEELVRTFGDLDVNGDGAITEKQLTAGLRRISDKVSGGTTFTRALLDDLGVSRGAGGSVKYVEVLDALVPGGAAKAATSARARGCRGRFMTATGPGDAPRRPPRKQGAQDLGPGDTMVFGGAGMTDGELAAAGLQEVTGREGAEATAARVASIRARLDTSSNLAASRTAEGVLTLLREKAHAKGFTPGLFNWLDADCDGVLSVDELVSSLQLLHIQLPRREAARLVDAWAGTGDQFASTRGSAPRTDALSYADFARAVESRDPLHERTTALRGPPKSLAASAGMEGAPGSPRHRAGSEGLQKDPTVVALWEAVRASHPTLTSIVPMSHAQARQLHLSLDTDVDNHVSIRDLAVHLRQALADSLTLKITDQKGARVRGEMQRAIQELQAGPSHAPLPAPQTDLDHAIAGVLALADRDGDGWLSRQDMLAWSETLSSLDASSRPLSAGAVTAHGALARLQGVEAALAAVESSEGGLPPPGPAPVQGVSGAGTVVRAAHTLVSQAVEKTLARYAGAHLTSHGQPVHPAISATLVTGGARDPLDAVADRQLGAARDAVAAKQSTIKARTTGASKAMVDRGGPADGVGATLAQAVGAAGKDPAAGTPSIEAGEDSSDDDAGDMAPGRDMVRGATQRRGVDSAATGRGSTTYRRECAAWSQRFEAAKPGAFEEVARLQSARAVGMEMPAAGASRTALARREAQASGGLGASDASAPARASSRASSRGAGRDGSLFQTTEDLLRAPVPAQALKAPTRYGAKAAALKRSTAHVVQPQAGSGQWADDDARLQSVARAVMAQGLSSRSAAAASQHSSRSVELGLGVTAGRARRLGLQTRTLGGTFAHTGPLSATSASGGSVWGGPTPGHGQGDVLCFTGRGDAKRVEKKAGGHREAKEQDIVRGMQGALIAQRKKEAARVELKRSLRTAWEGDALARHARNTVQQRRQFGNPGNASTLGLVTPVLMHE